MRWIAFSLFLLWELYWLYQLVTRPIPDEEMQSVAAILFGVILPLAGLLIYGASRLLRMLLCTRR